MSKSKLPAKQERQKSTLAYFPTKKDIFEYTKDMTKEEQDIFIDGYNSLKLINHNNVYVLPLLKAYAQQWAAYYKVKEEYGDKHTIMGAKEIPQINPMATLSIRHMQEAIKIGKQLGLDPISRTKLEPGAQPEKPQQKGVKEFK